MLFHPSYFFESTVNFIDRNYFYTRLELVDKLGLLEENIFGRPGLGELHQPANGLDAIEHADQAFRVGAFTLGGVRDILISSKLRIGVGGDVTFYHVPGGLEPVYGTSPTSFHFFVRIRPGKTTH